MGQARRRKMCDPNYGKPKATIFSRCDAMVAQQWWQESQSNAEEKKLLPDYGHWFAANLGIKHMHMHLSGEHLAFKERIAGRSVVHVSTGLGELLITVYLSPETYKTWKKDGHALNVIPNIEDRFYSKGSGEWIIPFYEFRDGLDSVQAA